jgi:aminoglycoside phosphotransferase (APT) family kinase protein
VSNTANLELARSLGTVLTRAWGRDVTVDSIHRLSGGASMETWLAELSEPPSRVILRRDRPGAPTSSREAEASLLTRAAHAGVPVPAVLASGAHDELGPAYLVMEHIIGETIPRKLLRDAPYAFARTHLVAQVGHALARIHTIPASEIDYLGPALTTDELVTGLEKMRVQYGCTSPVLELAAQWLHAHVPDEVAPALVHGDVRNGNLMVTEQGLSAVLDWELAHSGQPAEDLGWFCVRAWRFGSSEPAGGFGSREALLETYHEAGGTPISPETLRFWELYGTFKWAVTCLTQVAIHLRGDVRSVELAAIGRRVGEVEYDLVRLMREGS